MPGSFHSLALSPRSPKDRQTTVTREPCSACSAMAPPQRQTKSAAWALMTRRGLVRHLVLSLTTGGVPWVWNVSMVLRPQAWPFLRSASVQVTVSQSGGEDQPGAGIGELDPVAGGLPDIEEEGALDGVLVRPGLDVDAVLEEDVGGAQDVLALVDGVGEVVEAAVAAPACSSVQARS